MAALSDISDLSRGMELALARQTMGSLAEASGLAEALERIELELQPDAESLRDFQDMLDRKPAWVKQTLLALIEAEHQRSFKNVAAQLRSFQAAIQKLCDWKNKELQGLKTSICQLKDADLRSLELGASDVDADMSTLVLALQRRDFGSVTQLARKIKRRVGAFIDKYNGLLPILERLKHETVELKALFLHGEGEVSKQLRETEDRMEWWWRVFSMIQFAVAGLAGVTAFGGAAMAWHFKGVLAHLANGIAVGKAEMVILKGMVLHNQAVAASASSAANVDTICGILGGLVSGLGFGVTVGPYAGGAVAGSAAALGEAASHASALQAAAALSAAASAQASIVATQASVTAMTTQMVSTGAMVATCTSVTAISSVVLALSFAGRLARDRMKQILGRLWQKELERLGSAKEAFRTMREHVEEIENKFQSMSSGLNELLEAAQLVHDVARELEERAADAEEFGAPEGEVAELDLAREVLLMRGSVQQLGERYNKLLESIHRLQDELGQPPACGAILDAPYVAVAAEQQAELEPPQAEPHQQLAPGPFADGFLLVGVPSEFPMDSACPSLLRTPEDLMLADAPESNPNLDASSSVESLAPPVSPLAPGVMAEIIEVQQGNGLSPA